VGVETAVDGVTTSFGRQVIRQDVSLTLPAGEISVMLGLAGPGRPAARRRPDDHLDPAGRPEGGPNRVRMSLSRTGGQGLVSGVDAH
jgi:hypothetical protein